MANKRCAFHEEGRRCRRIGFGNPPLCRAHVLLLASDADPQSDFGHLVEATDRAVSRTNGSQVLQSFLGALGAALVKEMMARHRQARVGSIPTAARAEIPPRRRRAAPRPAEAPSQNAREVLGFGRSTPLTAALVKERQRELAALCHPDRGGSTRQMQRINAAATELLANLA
jgi:hypothetical protein